MPLRAVVARPFGVSRRAPPLHESLSMVARVVSVDGDEPLVRRLGPALDAALSPLGRRYLVHVHPLGRLGEVLVCVEGSAGRAPIILAPHEQQPELVTAAVKGLVARAF
jgi:hypothetical protein